MSDGRTVRLVCLGLLSVYAALFAFDVLTRTMEFDDPDTMNFVDVARNISSGVGVRQSALGMNQPRFGVDDPVPTHLTHQPPLYPLAIAAVSRAGLSAPEAGALISVLCYAWVLFAGYHIVRQLFGEREALAAAVLLALFAPLRDFSDSAFSEPAGLALLFGVFWLLACYAAPGSTTSEAADEAALPAAGVRAAASNSRLALVAGVLTGIAFATRYALAPLAVAGAWFIWTSSRRVRDVALFLGASAVPAALIVLRNMQMLNGSPMPHYLASQAGYLKNISATLSSLVSQYIDVVPAPVQLCLLIAVVAVACATGYRRQRLKGAFDGVILHGRGTRLLAVFAMLYMAFLIVQRTHSHIDPIGPRYLLPASVALVMLFAAFVVRATGLGARFLGIFGCVAVIGLIGLQVAVAVATPRYDAQRFIDASPRLSWLQRNAAPADLVIGEDTVDVPFYMQGRAAVSFSPFPYTETLGYEKTLGLCRRFKSGYARILLVLRVHPDTPQWLPRLGPFIHDLSQGRIAPYAQMKPLVTLSDGRIFRIDC